MLRLRTLLRHHRVNQATLTYTFGLTDPVLTFTIDGWAEDTRLYDLCWLVNADTPAAVAITPPMQIHKLSRSVYSRTASGVARLISGYNGVPAEDDITALVRDAIQQPPYSEWDALLRDYGGFERLVQPPVTLTTQSISGFRIRLAKYGLVMSPNLRLGSAEIVWTVVSMFATAGTSEQPLGLTTDPEIEDINNPQAEVPIRARFLDPSRPGVIIDAEVATGLGPYGQSHIQLPDVYQSRVHATVDGQALAYKAGIGLYKIKVTTPITDITLGSVVSVSGAESDPILSINAQKLTHNWSNAGYLTTIEGWLIGEPPWLAR